MKEDNNHSRRRRYAQCETDFQLELSRGASFISSCLTPASMRAVIAETLDSFVAANGSARLPDFAAVLAAKLAARGRMDAADEVLAWPRIAQVNHAVQSSLPPGHLGNPAGKGDDRDRPSR